MNIIDKDDKLFYIGGVVRDELLGIQARDIDVTYVGDVIEFCANLNQGNILQVNEAFGTVRMAIDNEVIDFASTRSESYPKAGHLPVVREIGCSLKEDVIRRDFTINALVKSVKTGEIVDYVGGLEDIKARKIRVLHDKSFIDDPTRILRAVKFAARFDFEIEEHTLYLIREYLKNINYDMSYKRLKKELTETLTSSKAFEMFIKEGMYKLLGPDDIIVPKIGEASWLVYLGIISDLSALPLTKHEKKIITDGRKKLELNSDLDIYKAFTTFEPESLLIYGTLYGMETVRRFNNYLKDIKLTISGNDLLEMGYAPSDLYGGCFDYVLQQKFSQPQMSKDDELTAARDFFVNIR